MAPLEASESARPGGESGLIRGPRPTRDSAQRRQQSAAIGLILLVFYMEQHQHFLDSVVRQTALLEQRKQILLLVGDVQRQINLEMVENIAGVFSGIVGAQVIGQPLEGGAGDTLAIMLGKNNSSG